MFRRETMIALRARRTAVRIASLIAYPRVEMPPQPIASNAPPDEPPAEGPSLRDDVRFFGGWAGGMLLLALIAFLCAYWR